MAHVIDNNIKLNEITELFRFPFQYALKPFNTALCDKHKNTDIKTIFQLDTFKCWVVCCVLCVLFCPGCV